MLSLPCHLRIPFKSTFSDGELYQDKQVGHLRRYTREMLQKRFDGWKTREVYYTGHTAKVFMTLFNIIIPIFDEQKIEAVDEKKLFS